MSAKDFDDSLTCLQKVLDHRWQEVLAIVGGCSAMTRQSLRGRSCCDLHNANR